MEIIETDQPPEPDWRRRYEENFEQGLSIEWNTRSRQFWIVRQAAGGSEDYVDVNVGFEVAPGDGRDAVLENLRVHAETTRKLYHPNPDIKFKAVEIDPYWPERQLPEYVLPWYVSTGIKQPHFHRFCG